MGRSFPLAAPLVLLTHLLPAQGGPPLITDDPGTPGDGVWEINVAFTAEKGAEGEWLLEAPLLDINYGVGERIQLKLETPWVWVDEDGEPAKNGLGNTEVGVKWRFLDQEEHRVDMSVYPQVSFNNPTSSVDRGLVDEGTEVFLPVELERRFGRFAFNPEAGFVIREEDEEGWEYGLAVGYQLLDELELLGEIHGETDDGLERHEIVFNVGGRWEMTPGLDLLVAAGRGLRGAGSGEPEILGYVGLQFIF